MDSSRVIASISTALDRLQLPMDVMDPELTTDQVMMMHKLRVVRTFVLCSKKLGSQVHLRPGDNNDDSDKSLQSLKNRIKKKKGKMKAGLKSLLVKVEDVICRILDDIALQTDILEDLELIEEEMDKWYTSLSDYFQQYQSSPVANLIRDMADSVLENLEDYVSFEGTERNIEPWKGSITFIRNFIHFASLLCAEHQKFQGLFTRFEALVIRAAHLTLHLSPRIDESSASMTNCEAFGLWVGTNGLDSLVSYETCTWAMKRLRQSGELQVPTLDMNDDHLTIMKEFNVFLLSTLWEMLQRHTGPVVPLKDKLQAVYEGLRWLMTVLKKQPNKFDDDKIRDSAGAVLCDVGVMIFLLEQEDFVIDHGLVDFLKNIKVIRAEVFEEQVVKTSRFNFPSTNVLGFLDFLLEDYLMEVNSSKVDSDTLSYVPKIQENLTFLRLFMRKLVELRNQQEDPHQAVWNDAVEVAYKIELLIDQMVLGDILDSFSASFQSIAEDIMIIKKDFMKIFDESRQEIKVQKVTWTSTDQVPSQSSTPTGEEVVGFEAERTLIIDQLTRGPRKLQVVAIVGMPGSGKTTLAEKVFNHPPVGYHFHVRARCSISQVFDRRKVLLELLNQIQPGGISAMNEDDLSQQLWRSLRRRRYLIFVDDIWDAQTYTLLKGSLPDDSNQSRILLTSRHSDVVPGDMLNGKPLFLPQLTRKESLELLRRKLFPAGTYWPSPLHEFGMEIAEYCKGLPLTVVIVVGLLKTTQQENWKEVLESLRSGIISTTDQCMNTIELSYKHLPDHLKPCFLSFGAFPEDHVVSVKRLIWQWIAEGFVRKSESKSLEEVATQYLQNLIGRSLVMSAKERTTGGVKACRIHDLIHDFCLRKATEDNFLHLLNVCGDGELKCFDEPGNLRRLSIHCKPEHFKKSKMLCPRLRSLLFFHPTEWAEKLDMSFISCIFKLLRVLGMDQVELIRFPRELRLLVQLRYLAIQVPGYEAPSIGKLVNLETLILILGDTITLPDTIWNLQKLRHLHSVHKYYGAGTIRFPYHNLDSSCALLELESLSTVYSERWSNMEKLSRKFPNIRQLKCKLNAFEDEGTVMSFSFLSQLESLSLTITFSRRSAIENVSFSKFEFIFPENIKKLSLSGCELPWSKILRIAGLPNLAVLKLLWKSFVGDAWHVEEGEFPKLQFLKLEALDIVTWTASDYQFLNLQKLVLERCRQLKEIPECLENAPAFKVIEVRYCGGSVVSSVLKIKECQMDFGNSDFKVLGLGQHHHMS